MMKSQKYLPKKKKKRKKKVIDYCKIKEIKR